MANTTITDLPNATTPLGPEYIVLDQGGETKRLQLSDLFLNSGSETITSLTQNGNVLSYTNEAGVVNTIDTETVTSLSLLNGVLSYTDEVAQTTNLTLIPDGSIGYAKLSLGAPTWNEAGGLTISGHSSPNLSGASSAVSAYASDATNLWLKGNSAGVSGVFFESSANGYSINETSDGAFIQYRARGIGNTTGEQSDLVIGIANDDSEGGTIGAEDKIIFNIPGRNQLVTTYDAGVTEHKIWHAGNDGANSGLDADLLDGKDGSLYVTTDTIQNITAAKTFQDEVNANGTVFNTYYDNVNFSDSPNDPGVLTVGVELGLGLEPADGKLQSFIDFHAGNVYPDYAARIWRRDDGEFEISQRGPAALRLTTAAGGNSPIAGANIALTNETDTLTPNLIIHQADDHKFINIAGTEQMKITADGDIFVAGDTVSVGNATAAAFIQSSDYRLKEDITSIDNSIERLKQLKPCNFAWKSDGTRVDGFIAHEAQEIVPAAIAGTKDAIKEDGTPDYQGIDQSKLIPLLTKALQDAIARIEVLEAK